MTYLSRPALGSLTLGAPAMDRLMPMHLRLDDQGCIRSVGPTLVKLLPAGGVMGVHIATVFALRRPALPTSLEALKARAGSRIHLALLGAPELTLRGLAVDCADGGMLINLSFGIGVTEGVRRYGLTVADFAPTDLAVEMLYLVEAKSAVMDELRNLNLRLNGARIEAEHLALTDTLTGLRNRRALDLHLDHLIATAQPFALVHLDLDYFKQVNDTLGHAAGDHVLCEVARVLTSETRGPDLAARVGGDEFVMLLPGLVEMEAVAQILQRIITRVTVPIPFEEKVCRISASAGMTLSVFYDQPDAEQMSADADEALYASKRAGRGRATPHRPAQT